MKRPATYVLTVMAGLFAAAASAQTDQPAPPSQSTQTVQPAQVAASTPTAQPEQPAPPIQSTQTVQAQPAVQPAPAAQPPAPPQPPRPPKQVLYGDPCRSDLENFCTGNQPQAIRMRCLDSHEAEFSKGCQTRRAELRDLRASCKAVIEQSCRYVPLFADAILNCLQEHEAELVDPCKSLRDKALKPSRFVAAACQSDFKKFCKDLPMNGFRIAQCLQEHEAELSKPCLAGAPEK
ncbi:MAG: hypothetical protein NTY77_07655 [Elusimicrobia bacterium]|nr:hypothetical protein [Elusimicrobiota bacterium]